jgi:hypothetical protein
VPRSQRSGFYRAEDPAGDQAGDASAAVADGYFGSDVGDAELLEFLATDLDPTPADPLFREELREQCWSLVQDGVTARPKDH